MKESAKWLKTTSEEMCWPVLSWKEVLVFTRNWMDSFGLYGIRGEFSVLFMVLYHLAALSITLLTESLVLFPTMLRTVIIVLAELSLYTF